MAFDFSFSDVNWLSVIVSALAAFAVGSLWYSPLMVGKRWQKEVGLSDESMKNANMGMIFGGAFVLNVIGAIALELLIGPESTAFKGLHAGLFVAVFWIATSYGITYLFTRKTLTLFLIDAGYYIIFYSVMGLILGAW